MDLKAAVPSLVMLALAASSCGETAAAVLAVSSICGGLEGASLQSAALGNRLVRLYMHEPAVVIHSQFLSLNELHVLDRAVAATRGRLSQREDESQQMKRGWDVDA